MMNLDKSTKRIAKRVNKGFQGYPQISLEYFGETVANATEVVVGFTLEEGAEVQEERFSSQIDAREDVENSNFRKTPLAKPKISPFFEY